MEITQDILKQILDYDPKTGKFTWKKRDASFFKTEHEFKRWNTRYCGREAGVISSDGYVESRIGGKNVSYHRLAWLYVYGELPDVIDHINGNRSDNRISNLRSVSKDENSKNRGIGRNNTSGFIGVSLTKDRKKWCAYIGTGMGREVLGYFDEIEVAIEARKIASKIRGFCKNHGTRYSHAKELIINSRV